MFGLDRVIEESNKERLYGKKPELPEKLDKVPIMTIDGDCLGFREPNEKEIKETINKIIEYLEWVNK